MVAEQLEQHTHGSVHRKEKRKQNRSSYVHQFQKGIRGCGVQSELEFKQASKPWFPQVLSLPPLFASHIDLFSSSHHHVDHHAHWADFGFFFFWGGV
jgi:hypothetical protein